MSAASITLVLLATSGFALGCSALHPKCLRDPICLIDPAYRPKPRLRLVDAGSVPVVFMAPEDLHPTASFSSVFGTAKTRDGQQISPRSWELWSWDPNAIPILGDTHYLGLEIALWWLTPDRLAVTEADVEFLSSNMSRSGLGLGFLKSHFDGPERAFSRAQELNLVPIGGRLGQRIVLFDRSEFLVLPVRGAGVLVAAANFSDRGSYERYRVWPRIVASIRIRDESEGPD